MTKEQEIIAKLNKDLELAKKEDSIDIDILTVNLETVLNMLNKKDKQIDLMTEFLGERDLGHYKNEIGGEILGIMRKYNKEDWKQRFEKLVKEEGE